MIGTSSAYIEGSAIFTMHPVTLAIPGRHPLTFKIFSRRRLIASRSYPVSGGSATLALGLFNSGGSAPDTNMFNNGLVSTTTTEAIGHAQNWLWLSLQSCLWCRHCQRHFCYHEPAGSKSGNNLNQSVINGFTGNVNLGQNAQNIAPLTIGSQYTEEFKITLQANGTLAMTNMLYAGVGTGGTILATNIASASGANILRTNFDAHCIGGNRTGAATNPTTNYINKFILTFTSSKQAGHYFTVTSSGNPCSGGVTIGLDGSVTTNDYLLYKDDVVYRHKCGMGTGSAIPSIAVEPFRVIHTVIASNTVTASMGPMYGSAQRVCSRE